MYYTHYSDAGTGGEYPAQMTSNAENVSIWGRHRDNKRNLCVTWSTVHSSFYTHDSTIDK